MTTARVVAVMLDGDKLEAQGVYMPLADRVAFERKFDVSVLEMARLERRIDDAGQATAPVPDLREERSAFFSWRLLHRAGKTEADFDAFLDNVERLEIEIHKDGPVDPTGAPAAEPPAADSPAPAPPPGSSPS